MSFVVIYGWLLRGVLCIICALLFVGRMNMCPREVSHFDCCKKEHVIEKKGWEMLARIKVKTEISIRNMYVIICFAARHTHSKSFI